MRAALQVFDRIARLGEHARGRRDVPRLARMTRAEERDLRRAEIEAADAVGRDERHRLERLQRAARHREEGRVAGAVQQPPFAIDDRDRAQVLAVDRVAAHHDGQRSQPARADGRRRGG
jgi:hypothetical protein